MAQVREGHGTDDRDGSRLQPLRDLDAGEGRTHEDRARLVHHQAGAAAGAVADEAAAGVLLHARVERAGGEPRPARARERVSDGGDLRLGEDHPRREAPVAAQLDARAEDVIGRQARLILGHVCQQHAPVRVADHVEPLVTVRAQRLIDLHVVPVLQSQPLEPDRRGVGPATGGHHQALAGQPASVLELELVSLGVAPGARGGCAQAHLHTERPQRGADFLGGELLLGGDQSRQLLHERDARPQRGVRRRELDADHPSPQDDQRTRDLLGGGRLAVGPRADLAQTRQRRHCGLAAGGEHHRPPRPQGNAPHTHLARGADDAAAAEELDPALREPRQLAGVLASVDHLVAPRERRSDVELAAGCLRRALHASCLGQGLGRAQQRL